MSCGLSETLPAVADSVPRLRSAVTAFAAAAGAGGQTLDQVRLAVSEAVTNAIVHAYVEHDEPGAVTVTAGVDRGLLEVTVSDGGRGMTPRLDSPGMGLGLPLIARSTHVFDVHGSSSGGTEMRMSFQLGR